MRVLHELVSRDGLGHVFYIRDRDNRDVIDGFISALDHKLKVGARSQSRLNAAGVAEVLAAWKLVDEIVQLHENCFIWKLEFVVVVGSGSHALLWHIWAPTAAAAHERFLNSVANDLFVTEAHRLACDEAMKGTWVRA